MKKFTYILAFLFCIIFTKNVYAKEIDIYFDNEITAYKAVEIDEYIYVPLAFYKDYAGAELTWLPETREVEVAFHPWGEPDWKVIQTLTIDSARITEMEESPETRERRLSAVYHGDYFGKPVIILNNRTMIPFGSVEDEYEYYGSYSNYQQCIFIPTFSYENCYHKGSVYFLPRPTAEQWYEIDEMDPDKWVLTSDEKYSMHHVQSGYNGSDTTVTVFLYIYNENDEVVELCRVIIPQEYFRESRYLSDTLVFEDFIMVHKPAYRRYINKDFILKKLAERNN